MRRGRYRNRISFVVSFDTSETRYTSYEEEKEFTEEWRQDVEAAMRYWLGTFHANIDLNTLIVRWPANRTRRML